MPACAGVIVGCFLVLIIITQLSTYFEAQLLLPKPLGEGYQILRLGLNAQQHFCFFLLDPAVWFFSQAKVKSREWRHLGNGTSDHRNENPKTLFNTNYPPKPGENHLRNHFRPLESAFSAIATYKT